MDISRRVLVSILFVLLVVPMCVSAQPKGFGTIEGTVKEAITGFPLSYANVTIVGTGRGMPTDDEGNFKFKKVPTGSYELRASYIGYTPMTQRVEVKAGESLMVDFTLDEAVIMGHEVLVSASRAKERETPVAFTEVQDEQINEQLATLDVPMVLNTTPSVYATESGGGAGDARLNVRGFNQRNIAVMINGVPVNDMENGWVYWSNWAGLGDVTQNIQVQRGLGASPYSVSSVGGVINIQTYSSRSALERKALLKQQIGSDKTSKTSVLYSSGLLENDIAFSVLLSKKSTEGYVDRAWSDEFGYFFTIGKRFGSHNLDLTLVGAPQRHGQRRDMESIATFAARGYDYNPNWGYLHGEPLDERVNFYHKPVVNLNWNWVINNQTLLSSVVYASAGTGGGTGPLGLDFKYFEDSNGNAYDLDWFPSTEAGLIDFDAAWEENTTNDYQIVNLPDSTGAVPLPGMPEGTIDVSSAKILRASRNNHHWYGFLSTVDYEYNKNLTLNAGVDWRYYIGEHYRTIENLLGGNYYIDIDKYNFANPGTGNNENRDPGTKLKVGDKVHYHNDGLVALYGGFLQAEYKNPILSAFVNISGSQTQYKRIDYFLDRDPEKTLDDFNTPEEYYEYKSGLDPLESDWESYNGYTGKTGLNYNINEAMNVFFNVGYLSKAPGFDFVFPFYTNEVAEDLENETTQGLEVGYGIRTSTMALLLNAYHTTWMDRNLDTTISGEDARYSITGMDAIHQGIELEARYFLTPEIELEGMLSIAENTWDKDVNAKKFSEDGTEVLDELHIATEGLYVGDFPMTTASLGMRYNVILNDKLKGYFHPVWKYFGRQYADFNPEDRQYDPEDDPDREQPWEMPEYYVVDIHTGFEIRGTDTFFDRAGIFMNLFNALDRNYIADAEDGADHDEHSASVYYGRGRTWNVGVSLEF